MDFAAIAAISDSKVRTQQYKVAVEAAVLANDETRIRECLERLLSDEVPQAHALSRLKPPALLEVAQWALEQLAPHAASFEDADFALRELLYRVLLEEGSFKEAAVTLAGINMETSARQYSEEEKAQMYVKIAETFLEDDESVDAELFVNKASALMHAVNPDDWSLKLRYRVTLARTLDSRRKFLDAAMRYYELSQAAHEEIAQDELQTLLAKAITCALLGNAGPQRSRILGVLYKDERLSHMEQSEQFAATAQILCKMFTGQLVRKPEIAAFETTLMPHQKALLGDGLSIPERATIQHNMVAVSSIYVNISFDELGTLLEIEPAKAEAVASRMIAEGRLNAKIDQVSASLLFNAKGDSMDDALQHWDDDITRVCLTVNSCFDRIRKLEKADGAADEDSAMAAA